MSFIGAYDYRIRAEHPMRIGPLRKTLAHLFGNLISSNIQFDGSLNMILKQILLKLIEVLCLFVCLSFAPSVHTFFLLRRVSTAANLSMRLLLKIFVSCL